MEKVWGYNTEWAGGLCCGFVFNEITMMAFFENLMAASALDGTGC